MADFRKHGSKQDDPLAGLTARALARSAAPVSACPDASTLAAYFERSLSMSESAQHEQHFAACVRCQQQLAVLARLETAVPVTTADPSQAADRGWRRAWNWKIWAPAAVAFGAVALWIAGQSATLLRAPVSTPAGTEIAQNRAPQPAPAESAPLSTDAISREVVPVTRAKPSIDRSLDAKKDLPLAGAKRDEPIPLAGRANQAPAAPLATPPPAPPAKETLAAAEERALAKLETADQAKLRDAEKKKQAAAESVAVQAAAAPSAEGERAQAKAKSSVAQEQALNRQRAASEGDVGFAGGLSARRTGLSAYVTIHAPAPSLALWRIGPGSTVEKSLDSGSTWQSQVVTARLELLAGSAASDKICWLVGRTGAVLRTTDGVTWHKLPAPTQVDLTAVEARDADNATVVAADGRRFATSDAGRTWRLQ